MRKTILTLAMTLMMALVAAAGPTGKAAPAENKPSVELTGDTLVVNDGDQSVAVSGLPVQKMRDKINRALDDTLTAGNGTTIEIGSHRGDLTPEDIKVISGQWAVTSQVIACASIIGLLLLVLLVMFFRFLNRRNRYRVIERAIENNYPIEHLPLSDVKRSAIYVQQPVMPMPPMNQPPMNQPSMNQPGNRATVGTPLPGTPAPVVTGMVNWRALMPAVKWLAWGLAFTLFGLCIDLENPFWPVGLALMLVGICKGFILYNEQKSLQEAFRRAQEKQSQTPVQGNAPTEATMGTPVPPVFNENNSSND